MSSSGVLNLDFVTLRGRWSPKGSRGSLRDQTFYRSIGNLANGDMSVSCFLGRSFDRSLLTKLHDRLEDRPAKSRLDKKNPLAPHNMRVPVNRRPFSFFSKKVKK